MSKPYSYRPHLYIPFSPPFPPFPPSLSPYSSFCFVSFDIFHYFYYMLVNLTLIFLTHLFFSFCLSPPYPLPSLSPFSTCSPVCITCTQKSNHTHLARPLTPVHLTWRGIDGDLGRGLVSVRDYAPTPDSDGGGDTVNSVNSAGYGLK